MVFKTTLLRDLPCADAGTEITYSDFKISPFIGGEIFYLEENDIEYMPKWGITIVDGKKVFGDTNKVKNEILALRKNLKWTKTEMQIPHSLGECPVCHSHSLISGALPIVYKKINDRARVRLPLIPPSWEEKNVVYGISITLCPICGKWELNDCYSPMQKDRIEGPGYYDIKEGYPPKDIANDIQPIVDNWLATYKSTIVRQEEPMNNTCENEYPMEGLVPPPTYKEWLDSLVDDEVEVPPEYSGEPSPRDLYDAEMDAVYGGWNER